VRAIASSPSIDLSWQLGKCNLRWIYEVNGHVLRSQSHIHTVINRQTLQVDVSWKLVSCGHRTLRNTDIIIRHHTLLHMAFALPFSGLWR